jgi:hypothetical protein
LYKYESGEVELERRDRGGGSYRRNRITKSQEGAAVRDQLFSLNADLRAAQVTACTGALTGDHQLNRFFQVQLGILDEETALALGGRATPYRRPIFAELWEETKDDYSADFQDFVRRGILPMVEETC